LFKKNVYKLFYYKMRPFSNYEKQIEDEELNFGRSFGRQLFM